MDDVLFLINDTKVQDSKGAWHRIEPSRRQVFCQVRSVSKTEFFDAGRNGLNPEFRFLVFAGDYEGETTLEYNGKTYSIYRTYRTPADYMELYVERQGGTNGKENVSG